MAVTKKGLGTSLVFQWIRAHLPMHGTWAQSLAQEDSMWHGATEPVQHTYCVPVRQPQLLKPMHLEPVPCKKPVPHN